MIVNNHRTFVVSMGEDPDLLQVLVDDVKTLRDNHLYHVEKDMSTMKLEMQSIDQRLSNVESFVSEIKDVLKKYGLYIMGLIVASMGLPMMM